MASLDAAYERASALIADVTPRLELILSEEDSKLQLITRFLTEVLEWNHANISCERHNENGYSDYVISEHSRPVFLLEAKRQGRIGVTTTATTRQSYKISGPALKPSVAGIEQAAAYCAPEGIQLAVVTDGIQWIFFKPFIPGENYKSKEAIVFPTLPSVLENFSEFYELCSKKGHDANLYKIIFDKLHQNRVLLTRGLHAAFTDKDIHPEQKSQLAFDLDKVFASIFTQLVGDDDPDLLIECFVETKESRIADFALEKLTTHVLGNIDPDQRDVDRDLQTLISNTISEKEGETVFIVGPSGAGKTTFLERFFKKTLPKNIGNRCVIVNINVLDASGDIATATAWFTNAVIDSIERQLYANAFPSWDDLLGLYHGEYLRRLHGVDAQLYARDKEEFKVKFGQYMEDQVVKDREGYLRRLLKDIVENRKKLPLFVVDNTDEFGLEYKQVVFQYFQSMRRNVKFCLLIFPVTDKSAWSFSKTEVFNIYSSRSYFLPTPAPREVFRKRVEYLKKKIGNQKKGKTSAAYHVGKSLRVSIQNLEGFASVVEDIFVEQDYVARRIGSLSNYNIRRTLALGRRIITSSVLKIEDLLNSYVLGQRAPIAPEQFMQGLIKGDYNFFKKGDDHGIFPIFDVDKEIQQSPLVHIRILALLKAVHDGALANETRYLDVSSVVQYFDAIGYTEAAVERSLSVLMTAGLIEPFDPSVGTLALAQRVAISHSGLGHLEIALFSPTFFEHQALTANIVNPDIAASIRAAYLTAEPEAQRLRRAREYFADYLLSEDHNFGQVPSADQYSVQSSVTVDLQKYSANASEPDLFEKEAVQFSINNGIFAREANCVVDWFDPDKGFGFVTIEDLHESAFLHASILEKSGIDELHDGDFMVCDISRGSKGLAVTKIVKILSSGTAEHTAIVVRIFDDRFYGFVYIPDLNRDAFFHFSTVPDEIRTKLSVGLHMRAEINSDRQGRGLQVRRILTS